MPIYKNNNLIAQAGYTLLEPSVIRPNPNPEEAKDTPISLADYLQGAYVALFVVVIVAAIVSLVYYGFTYMLSDVSNLKGEAKSRMTKVFIGLGIALISFVLLNEVNPDLLQISLERIGKLNPS